MGKVSYSFDCGWDKPTLSQGDILWTKEQNKWIPYKIKTILIDYIRKQPYTYDEENVHAIFGCIQIRKSNDHPYYVEKYDDEIGINKYFDEDIIGLSVYSRNPDEPVEEYLKRTGKKR